ncbi:diacylglycerol kinase family protein [Vagococcus sp.]|uniref:diacylglycerol kinase family protein n=1 Tax=Vagococcus sp. TaxID=1933889 RepID=UPI003F943D1F
MDLKDKQTSKNKSFLQSFHHATEGLWLVIKSERNMRYHLLAAISILCFSLFIGLNQIEWIILVFLIGLMFFAEIMNTSLERLVDLTTNKKFHPVAKEVKDMAAGGVLVISVIAVVIGLIIFLPKIISLF